MKRAFLFIVVPALLLVALGFAQTPPASTITDQTNIKGCLGGSDGSYTVVEDNTGRIFKITTSSVDLKPHLNHDVTLVGQKASGASSAAAENSFAVTELNMISEHCAAAATAPAATVSTLPETVVAPTPDATPPAQTAVTPADPAAAPAATVTTPAEPAVAPAAATPPAEPAIPPAAVAAPVATVSTPSPTTGRTAARPRKRSATPAVAATTAAVTASPSAESAGTPPSATTPAATSSPSPEPASQPAAAATTPAPTSSGWSLWLWITLAVLAVVIGTTFPFLNRWRKRKNLERTGAPNLSLTRKPNSSQDKSDLQGPRKAA